jgi:hypothetical protein
MKTIAILLKNKKHFNNAIELSFNIKLNPVTKSFIELHFYGNSPQEIFFYKSSINDTKETVYFVYKL